MHFISAPEMFMSTLDMCPGYGFSVDWWSVGVCAYEVMALHRPYPIHSTSSLHEVLALFQRPLPYPNRWTDLTVSLLANVSYARHFTVISKNVFNMF